MEGAWPGPQNFAARPRSLTARGAKSWRQVLRSVGHPEKPAVGEGEHAELRGLGPCLRPARAAHKSMCRAGAPDLALPGPWETWRQEPREWTARPWWGEGRSEVPERRGAPPAPVSGSAH
ncbi:hypothetical protein NDU88_006437 [Pleurodeles waltl]|uniref:Uncharacterized protein n=1 Tax=Pleurodeles waltl TaxID=8319 RepID=A0AAV7TX60_PLEWA|nr:hypothetical protein NDU88_006437 [Pleurodeles waltl]